MNKNIPILDISKIGTERAEDTISDSDYKDIAVNLRSALSTVGFVYLVGHGIPDSVIDDVFDKSKKFFEGRTTREKKESFPRNPVTTQGYVGPDTELLDKAFKEEDGEPANQELRESIDVNRLSKDNHVPGAMRNVFTEAREALLPLVRRFLKTLAISLDLPAEFFIDRHRFLIEEGNFSKLRSIYYPPIHDEVTPGLIRLGEHSDYGTVTFLFQDSIGGLEVKSKTEGWIHAAPIPGAVLVNVGDQMEIFTNGLYPATRHRLVVPKEEALQSKHRQSFVFFVMPDDDVVVEPVDGKRPKKDKYKAISARKHLEQKYVMSYTDFVASYEPSDLKKK